ncbi:helix-turn-helix domain-containing protein [Anaerovorax sp. IOR16]|uniref:helix-turn-helix domain-containing protein n=1 Tax=Anaerovorax sp. IOR16 TaxID=2773458 RepID=UPI0019D13417|nr:helix-turn-helix transcriptional regulator [Anaerovorax sp. IOR16]
MESLGERIAFLRKEKGLSQRKLMEILEFNNLSKYEKNQRQPNYEILKRIADFFNVSTDWLLAGEESAKAEKGDSVSSVFGELTSEEIRILQLFRQLSDRDKIKIEGIMEAKIDETKQDKRGLSSNYHNGEEAATREKKHA